MKTRYIYITRTTINTEPFLRKQYLTEKKGVRKNKTINNYALKRNFIHVGRACCCFQNHAYFELFISHSDNF